MTERSKIIIIDYTNWRGERGVRRIEPIRLDFTHTEWHPEPQWILWAHDLDRGAVRAFAMLGVHKWRDS